MSNKSKPAHGKLFIPWHLLGMAIFCLLAAGLVLAQASEAENARLFGYSARRIVLVGVLLLFGLAFSFVGVSFWKNEAWREDFTGRLEVFLASRSRLTAALVLNVALLAGSWLLYFLPPDRLIAMLGGYALYIEQLRPVFFSLIGISALALSLLLQIRFGIDWQALRDEISLLRLGGLLYAVLLLFWGLEAASGLGLGFDVTEWNAPGAPILATQVFFSLILAPSILTAGYRLWDLANKKFVVPPKQFWLDVALFLLVWALAAVLWLRTPAEPTYYSSPPVAPNFESYALSDAFNHDVIANNVLIGEGFNFGGLRAVRRPVYVLFLAGLEGLVGAQTDRIVNAQVLVLALFPATLFALGRALHNRLSGLVLAGLVTLREANSIALGGVINLSHAKLIMADLPAALALAACALAAVLWLKSSKHNPTVSLLVGGLFGGALLLRSQVLTLIPMVALLAYLAWREIPRLAWRATALFLIGVVLVASPWILRNRLLTGEWIIEDSIAAGFVAERYSFGEQAARSAFLPDETEGEYYARNMQSVKDFALANPGYVAYFVVDNYVRNLTLSFTPMPFSLTLRDLESHVRQLPYWPSWDGKLLAESRLPLSVNLFLLGLGLAVAWRGGHWAGLVPLFINLGFAINLALARVSGWRYNLPADWTMLLYYALGLGQLLLWLFLALRNIPQFANLSIRLRGEETSLEEKLNDLGPNRRRLLFAGLLLLMLGSSFSLIEKFNLPRYSTPSAGEAVSLLEGLPADGAAQGADLASLLREGELFALSGRALHPRYYAAGAGIPERDFALIDPMEFSRLTFYLIGPSPLSVVLPLEESDFELPNAADVLLLVCASNPGKSVAVVNPSGTPAILAKPDPWSYCFADVP